MILRMAFFHMFQKALHGLASRGKDTQTDHDEKDSLEKREKEANDSDDNEEPAKNEDCNRFEFVHIIISGFFLNRLIVVYYYN